MTATAQPHSAHSDLLAHATPTIASLQALVGEDMLRVNQSILDAIAQPDVQLIESIGHHIVASGGKRLRPSLTIACAMLCGYEGARHINLAASVELLHTATLLHDDVVDESTMRRGDQTANAIWSNQASVLVGDYLLGRAFQLMVADGTIEVLKILADASATIARGEVMQLMSANDASTSIERYLDVISTKTAALFAAAGELGAVVSGRADKRQALQDFGTYLGIAFQLVDDALDYHADSATLGKTAGDDFREGKMTLPVILAYHDGSEEERGFWRRTIEDGDQREEDLAHAIALIRSHHAIERALDEAHRYTQRAAACLQDFPESPAKHALLDTLAFCVARKF
jgi:octaprenyl-diphosphate synthase